MKSGLPSCAQLDSLDIGIIREMFLDPSSTNIQWDIRRSFRKIAQKLDTSDDTVRYRLKALESGVLRGWRVGINPSLLGYSTAYLFFDVHPESLKREVLLGVAGIPGLMWYVDYFGSFVGCMIAYRSPGSLKDISERLSKASRAEFFVKNAASFPKCTVTLSEMDWKIVGNIQKQPRKAYSEIARQLGSSTRTVRRRLDRLIHEKALYVLPDLNLGELRGSTAVSVNVFYADPADKIRVNSEVISKFREYLVVAQLNDFDQGFFELILPNLSRAEEVRVTTEAIPGVRLVSVRAMLNMVNLLGEVFRHDLEDQMARARGSALSESGAVLKQSSN